MHETHYFVVLISCLHETTEFDLKSRLYGSDISLNANYKEMDTNTNSNLMSYFLDISFQQICKSLYSTFNVQYKNTYPNPADARPASGEEE